MHRPTIIAAGATLAALAFVGPASAHNATIACDATDPTGYKVVPDFTWLDPVTTFGPTSATVVWRDRYTVTLPYPAGCVAPTPPISPPVVPTSPVPPPAPEQPAPQASPPPPPVIAPGRPEPGIHKKATPKPRPRITCRWLLAHRAGPRSYTARGFYYRCRVPVARKVPNPGVTG